MQGYDPTKCYDALKTAGLPPCPNDSGSPQFGGCCPGEMNPVIHSFCWESGNLYTPYQYVEAYNATKCSPNEYDPVKCDERVFNTIEDLINFLNTNPDYKGRNCYCCCSCMLSSLPMAAPTGMNSSEKMVVGDEVMKGNMISGNGNISMSWTPATVMFSQGTPPVDSETEDAPTMIFIYCGNKVSLVVTEDQLILMSTGKLKQASTMIPGDLLMAADGSSAKVERIKAAEWFGAIHHISINTSYSGDINDHLLNANGFVIGDFSIQMNQSDLGDYLEKGYGISSTEYHSKNKAMSVGPNEYALNNMKDK